jgi:5-methylthioadenosine/S-adenosylhomocysteine deaminase
MSTLLKSCQYVVTLDTHATVWRDVDLLIADGRIAAIGADLDVTAEETIDCRHRLVMPGLVNLHTHLAMTLLRGLAEDVDLQGFLQRVFAAEGAIMDAPTVALGTQLGALESLRGGITLAADMYFHPASGRAGAAAAGLRLATGPVLFDGTGPDGLTWDQRLAEVAAWPGIAADLGGPDAPTVVCPHSTYLVSPAHLHEIGQAVRSWPRPVLHTHVSENLAENEQVRANTGRTPVEVLHEAGLLDGHFPVVFGHGIHLTDSDRVLAQASATIAHCPGSNLKLASGALDWAANRAAGMRVGIGTDGTSSSNDLDMWVAMRLAALVARLSSGRPDEVTSVEILRAATGVGASALGMGDRLGSLEVGKDADVILLDTDAEHLTPIHDVHALLVFAAGRSDVSDVFVAGQRVIADRTSTRVDAQAVRAAARERAKAAANAAGGAQ